MTARVCPEPVLPTPPPPLSLSLKPELTFCPRVLYPFEGHLLSPSHEGREPTQVFQRWQIGNVSLPLRFNIYCPSPFPSYIKPFAISPGRPTHLHLPSRKVSTPSYRHHGSSFLSIFPLPSPGSWSKSLGTSSTSPWPGRFEEENEGGKTSSAAPNLGFSLMPWHAV